MRSLKFRAWDGKEYWRNIVPSPLPSPTLDICKKITDYDPEYYNMVDIIEDVEAIEQYTGLKDKNGKEIYEGDILQIDDHIVGDFEVVWHKLGWKIKRAIGYESLSVHKSEDCTVIGNIHENPELLEDK